ncbi:MAG: 3-oxoacyl-ACP reductase [Chitinophagales bacterium]|nr:3-oxoacyl-ACP reductase [Chitinophagales bacterium]
MSDFLQNPMVKQLAKSLNLPLPIPAQLKRNLNAYSASEIQNKAVAFVGTNNDLFKAITKQLKPLCNDTTIYADKLDAVVLSALDINKVEDSYDFFSTAQQAIKKLNKNARVVVLSQIDETSDEAYAVQKSFEGFSRALSKELGKNGTTVNHLTISNNDANNIAGAIFYFLSDKSSFITGQVVTINSNNESFDFDIQQPLKNKTAIVTGGARGIGAAAAKALAREGAKVIIVDIPQSEDDANKVAMEINADTYLIDVTKEEAAKSLQEYIIKNYKQLDILVNNAGITRDKTLAKMTEQQWNQVMQVNLKASIQLTNTFLAKGFSKMPKIVGLASISGIAGNVGQTNYSASKAGMIALAKALSETKKVYANAVAPGFIETKMTESLPLFVKEGGRRLSTLKQGGLPEDVAELITFLSSPLSDGINGQVIRVCGGSMIGA